MIPITFRTAQKILSLCARVGYNSLPNEGAIRILDRTSGIMATESEALKDFAEHAVKRNVLDVDAFDNSQKITGLLGQMDENDQPVYTLDGPEATNWNDKFRVMLRIQNAKAGHPPSTMLIPADYLQPIALDAAELKQYLDNAFEQGQV